MQQTTHRPQPQFTFEGGHLVMYHQESTGLPAMRDVNVNDCDRMFDLLSDQKYLTNEYNIAMLETSSEKLYRLHEQNHKACHQLQRQLFDVAFKKGWYRLPVADAQSVVRAFDHMQQMKSEWPFPAEKMATATTEGGASPQLANQVTQALHEVEHGRVPTGFVPGHTAH